MGTDLTPHIDALRHGTKVASLNYDVWWVYKSCCLKYVGTMNRYRGFFDTSLNAHFVALLVALYPLYETRRDTFNVPRLINIWKKDNAVPVQVLRRVNKRYIEAKSLWVKVGILRNEAFAHRSDSLTIAQIFKKAGVTPNELKRLIELTKSLLNDVTRSSDRGTHAFNLGASDATVSLLKNLKAHHEG